MLAARDELERIELGDEMAARPVVADQHAGAERVARGGKRLLLGEGRRLDGPAELPRHRSVRAQDGPRASARTSSLIVVEAGEESSPLRIDRGGVLFVAGVELGEVGGVGAMQERRVGKHVVQFMSRHWINPAGR